MLHVEKTLDVSRAFFFVAVKTIQYTQGKNMRASVANNISTGIPSSFASFAVFIDPGDRKLFRARVDKTDHGISVVQ